MLAGEQGVIEHLGGLLDDLQGFQHASCAHITTGLAAGTGAENVNTFLLQDQQVLLGAGVCPHLLVHGRSDGNGGARRQAERGEQVVTVAMGKARHEVGGGRSDQHQVGPAGQLDMAHGGLGGRVQQGGVDRMAGQGLHGQRGNELAGALGHHNPDLGARVLQAANQIGGLVGGDATGDSQKDALVDQTLHAKTLNG